NSNKPWVYDSRFNPFWSYSNFAECPYTTDKNIPGAYLVLPKLRVQLRADVIITNGKVSMDDLLLPVNPEPFSFIHVFGQRRTKRTCLDIGAKVLESFHLPM